MQVLLALFIGILGGLGVRLLMTRNFVKIVLGIALLGNGINLFLFEAGGLRRSLLSGGTADPVAEAVILTAIVVGFGVQAFTLVLVYRVFVVTGSEDPDALEKSEARPGREGE